MTDAYRVSVLRRAQKVLATIASSDYERVGDALRELAQKPRPAGCKKLVGRPGWRLRVGRFRIIYEIDDNARSVTILDIGDRRDIYR